jgi:hypothetical protein
MGRGTGEKKKAYKESKRNSRLKERKTCEFYDKHLKIK